VTLRNPEVLGLIPASETARDVFSFAFCRFAKGVHVQQTAIVGRNLTLIVHHLSDLGCVRDHNEDVVTFRASESPTRGSLLVLADGMGGAAAGEVASRLAADTVIRRYFDPALAGLDAQSALARAVLDANEAVFAASQSGSHLSGMGTTCTALAITGMDFFIAHVGDSRAYRIEDGSIEQLTEDHSLAEEMRRRSGGVQAPSHVPRNILSRCLGVGEIVDIDLIPHIGEVKPGLTLLLCSDGLSGLVPDTTILDHVRREPPDVACRRLIDAARTEGGPDNISVLIATVIPTRSR
jgi:protein phosphatase